MNWSAGLVAVVPPGVVTVTSTVPEPPGRVAVMEVALFTVKVVAADAELHAGGAGEVGPGDGDRGPAGGGPEAGLTRGDGGRRRRRCSGRPRWWRWCPAGVVHGDVDGAGAGRGGGGDGLVEMTVTRWRPWCRT